MPEAGSPTVADADAQLEQLGVHVPLKGVLAQRVGDALVGAAAAVSQYFFAGVFVALALNPSIYNAHPTAEGRVTAVAFAIAIYAFGRWGRRQIRRAAMLSAGLIVTPDSVIVRHEGLLTEPVVIGRDAVEAVAIDDGGSRVAVRRLAAGLPMLEILPRNPNLVLVFDYPVDFPARRRRVAPERRLPESGEHGLSLRVKDPAAARRAFAGWPLRPR